MKEKRETWPNIDGSNWKKNLSLEKLHKKSTHMLSLGKYHLWSLPIATKGIKRFKGLQLVCVISHLNEIIVT